MKICLISQEYPPETGGGGIGTQTFLKAHGLTARGHEVHVVSASWDNQPHVYNDGKATIHRIVFPSMSVPGYETSSCWLAYSQAVAAKLIELSSTIDFDIMQFPEYGGEGFFYQTDTFAHRRCKYVVQLHGPLVMFAHHMGWPDIGSTFEQVGCFMERTVMHHADLILASSHSTARLCAEHYDYDVSKIGVVHSGIDVDYFSPQPQPASDKSPRVLFVGKLSGSKGFDLIVSTVLRIRERYPNIVVRLIGKGDKDHLADVRKRITKENADRHFEFLGHVPHAQLPEHYAWCDMFAGPSVYEGGPGNVYLEAMSCARPVIACDSGGAPEVVLDGKTGMLIPPRDGDALERVIIMIADDAALRERLGTQGRQWVTSEFSIPRYIDKVEQHYLKLLTT